MPARVRMPVRGWAKVCRYQPIMWCPRGRDRLLCSRRPRSNRGKTCGKRAWVRHPPEPPWPVICAVNQQHDTPRTGKLHPTLHGRLPPFGWFGWIAGFGIPTQRVCLEPLSQIRFPTDTDHEGVALILCGFDVSSLITIDS